MDTEKTSSPETSDETLRGKYIRTFSGDMDTFKKGGTPGLMPLDGSQPAVVSKESEDLMEQTLSSPTVEEEPIIESPPTSFFREPEKEIEPEPIKFFPPTQVEEFSRPSPIETYSNDFRDRMKETQSSTMTVLAAEQDAGQVVEQVSVEPKHTTRNILYTLGGVLLLGVGGSGLYITYSNYVANNLPVIVTVEAPAPIFVDLRENVSGTGATLTKAIAQSADTPLGLNIVKLLFLNSASSSPSIFSALALPAPDVLLRNIDTARSMIGIVHTSAGQAPFFILSVASYSVTFSGMLLWEPTMQSDLGVLFPLYPSPVDMATTSVSSVHAQNVLSAKAVFRDEVVSNHDVRIYRDALGRSIMLYGYWDQATLVIARDPSAFAEILGRLATSHK